MALFDRREPTGVWWKDHGLSIVLIALMTVQTALALWWGHKVWEAEEIPVGFWTWWAWEYNISLVADTFGVVLIVLLTKWLREKDSAESD